MSRLMHWILIFLTFATLAMNVKVKYIIGYYTTFWATKLY